MRTKSMTKLFKLKTELKTMSNGYVKFLLIITYWPLIILKSIVFHKKFSERNCKQVQHLKMLVIETSSVRLWVIMKTSMRGARNSDDRNKKCMKSESNAVMHIKLMCLSDVRNVIIKSTTMVLTIPFDGPACQGN